MPIDIARWAVRVITLSSGGRITLRANTPIEMDLNVGQYTHTELSGQLFQMQDHGSKFRSGQEVEEEHKYSTKTFKLTISDLNDQ